MKQSNLEIENGVQRSGSALNVKAGEPLSIILSFNHLLWSTDRSESGSEWLYVYLR